ncbi:hypothetical protein MN608_09696 [Microdochium nivale]|nr:hypothetical protein MN608_09696 [Microdochium nivale]
MVWKSAGPDGDPRSGEPGLQVQRSPLLLSKEQVLTGCTPAGRCRHGGSSAPTGATRAHSKHGSSRAAEMPASLPSPINSPVLPEKTLATVSRMGSFPPWPSQNVASYDGRLGPLKMRDRVLGMSFSDPAASSMSAPEMLLFAALSLRKNVRSRIS